MPKSNRAALPTKRANWTITGSLRPRRWRSSARCSGVVSTADHLVDRIADEAEHHERDQRHHQHDAERPAQAPDGEGEHSVILVELPSPGATIRPALALRRGSVQLRPVEQNLVVGALDHVEVLALAPGQRLLVQRDVRGYRRAGSGRPRGSAASRLAVSVSTTIWLGQLVDLRVAVAAQVERTALAGRRRGSREADQHVPASRTSRASSRAR